MELLESAIKNKLTSDVDGTSFYIRRYRNGQDIDKLVSDVKNLIAEHNLSVSEAKGFCEYMKIILEANSKV